MGALLRGYEVNELTWFYLSFLLIVAVYFRFTRVFSLRNFDLALLLSASPGLLFLSGFTAPASTENISLNSPKVVSVAELENSAALANNVPLENNPSSRQMPIAITEDLPAIVETPTDPNEGVKADAIALGYVWLFVVACIFLLRLFLDSYLSRRPYLGQNLNSQGLGFLCFCAFLFLMTKAITEDLPSTTAQSVANADFILSRTATEIDDEEISVGPAAPLFPAIVGLVFEDLAPKILVILSHLAVITGLWFVGRNLFGDCNLGLAMATLYQLLPCTSYNVGQVNHVLPSALIIWAFVSYRKPVVAGILLGLACGTMFFPVALLPLWAAYYGRKGAWRFTGALCVVAVILLMTLAMTSIDHDSFIRKTIGTINVPLMAIKNAQTGDGFWHGADYLSVYRWPLMTLYMIMIIVMTIWPRRRNIEVLLAQSTAAIVGTQLWYTQNGGVYLLWYFPLMLMVIFRPRLLKLKSFEELPEQEETVTVQTKIAGKSISKMVTSNSRLQLFR